MAVDAITDITFFCDCCGAIEKRQEAEGYEVSRSEKPPQSWRYFRAQFVPHGNGTELFLLCGDCSCRVAMSLSSLKTPGGQTIS